MATVLVVLFLFILQPSILAKSKMECPNGQKSYKSSQIRLISVKICVLGGKARTCGCR